MKVADIKRAACVGGGVIGSSWAIQFAMRGLAVTLYDINDEQLKRSEAQMHKSLDALEQFNAITPERRGEIVAAIRVVARGDALIQPSVMRRLVETFVAARPRGCWGAADVAETRRAALTSLTDREREILVLVARGLSNDEIAEELFISPATVKTHLARVMAKTDAHDRAQLVVFAYETGLVTPAP